MAIYVDADACPVKAEVERVATRHRLRVVIVSNGGIRPSQNPLIVNVIVAEGRDEADKWIAERAGPGDVVITGDIPLAAKCVTAGVQVLKHDGEALTAENIGNVLTELAAAGRERDTLMIDATHLKAHRTASSLRGKKGGVAGSSGEARAG